MAAAVNAWQIEIHGLPAEMPSGHVSRVKAGLAQLLGELSHRILAGALEVVAVHPARPEERVDVLAVGRRRAAGVAVELVLGFKRAAENLFVPKDLAVLGLQTGHLAAQALELAPDAPNALDTLGWICVRRKEYDEAAEVFGATRWQRFTRVTLPLLRPSLQTALILRVPRIWLLYGINFLFSTATWGSAPVLASSSIVRFGMAERVGGSFTGVTVMLTVPAALSTTPSLTRNVKLSPPV